MDAGTQTLDKLFESPKQVFQIPTFQRQYVWRLDDQWEPLWEDVRNLAERFGDLLAEGRGLQEAQKEAGRHFLGAVVVQRLDLPFGKPETWELIDGQQRLTTLQLLLHATFEVLVECGLSQFADTFEMVVRNYRCTGNDVYKLWPTGGDQAAFQAVMDLEADASKFSHSQIVKAHSYFRNQVSEWLSSNDTLETRAHHLQVALLALIELVVIKLDGSDDAFVIFETLNARGTPLLAADLVKNYVLQNAVQQQHDKNAFHRANWKHFEEDSKDGEKRPWWLTEIRQGRIYRPRLDVFLNHWLVMRHKDEVKARNLFPTFKKYVEETSKDDIQAVIQDFNKVASSYWKLDNWPKDSPERRFMYRWRVVQAGVLTPVLLQILSASENILTKERRVKALLALESYLVRRLVCRLTTKDYNKLFLELVRKLDGSISAADEVIKDYLLSQDAYSRVWPTDEAVREAITKLPLYGRINQGRIRMILEGLEERLRLVNLKSEEDRAPRNLELEHIMPRKWQTHWPLPLNEDPDAHHKAIQRRGALIHTLGNLTLVTGKLNKSVSNNGWEKKQRELAKHTTMHLNKEILANFGEVAFDETAILERGERLATIFCQTWERPGVANVVD